MRHMYSHPGEYRKIFLANYLCIGFVPGGNFPKSTYEEQSREGPQHSQDLSKKMGHAPG